MSDTSDPYGRFAARRAAAAAVLTERELAAAWVTDLVNVRYLTGFTGSNAALLLLADGTPRLASDGRYTQQVVAETGLEPVLVTGAAAPALWTVLADTTPAGDGPRAVGVETDQLSYDQYAGLDAERGPTTLAPLAGLVQTLRQVKDDEETRLLRKACRISTAALEDLLAGPLVGRTERALTRALGDLMLDHGADAVAFDTIMASGPHSSIPHHQPGDRAVQPGDLLKIDFGALVDGYHADCTRTVVVAEQPADWQREVHDAVREANAVGVAEAVPGADARAVHEAVTECLRGHGLAEHFTHGLGHGVGLQIHEDPFLGPRATATLAPGAVITIEPGVYLPGRGGVRIEDTLVVRPDGPELLTTADRSLRVVG